MHIYAKRRMHTDEHLGTARVPLSQLRCGEEFSGDLPLEPDFHKGTLTVKVMPLEGFPGGKPLAGGHSAGHASTPITGVVALGVQSGCAHHLPGVLTGGKVLCES